MSQILSLQTLAKKTEIGSHHTVAEYIQILEDCFALKTLYALDHNTGSLKFRSDKKFYFTDPVIFQLALDWGGYDIPENYDEIMAEMVAHESLSRIAGRLGYFHSANGEIDFIEHKKWAIEVKWSDSVSNLSKAYKNILIPQKIVWSMNNYLLEFPNRIK